MTSRQQSRGASAPLTISGSSNRGAVDSGATSSGSPTAVGTTVATPSTARGGSSQPQSSVPQTAVGGGPQVACSQDALFFPLPITGGIENIVQFSNLESSKIAFKIRSTIRQRYAVKPTAGFLHPREEVIVKFLLDPVTMVVDGEAPGEGTKDAFLIDFAFVSPRDESEASASANSTSASAIASAFWKRYSGGAAPPGGVHRKRLACVYATSSEVPTSLRVHVSTPAALLSASSAVGGAGAAAAVASPSGSGHFGAEPATPKSTTHFSSGQRPKGQSLGSSSATPQGTPTLAGRNQKTFDTTPPSAAVSEGRDAAGSYAVPSSVPGSVSAGSRAGGVGTVATAAMIAKTNSGASSTTSAAAARAMSHPPCRPVTGSPTTDVGPLVDHEPFVRAFLFASIPMPVVILLLVLSFVAALVENNEPLLYLLGWRPDTPAS